MNLTTMHTRTARRYQTITNRSTIPTAGRLGLPISQNRRKTPPEAWKRLAWGILGFAAAAALSAIAASLPTIAN